MDIKTVLIGVDGGATETKAHLVHCDNLENPTGYELGDISASRKYEKLADFVPVPVAEQFAQRDGGNIKLTGGEKDQREKWVQAAIDAVSEVARKASAKRVLVGMGMPGLKTPDGRGICVINNGPRIPNYLEEFEQGLNDLGIELVDQVAALGSDADYCGLGELRAAEGMFQDVDNSYYVGCGTGIADAMKLRGKLVTFDQAKDWIQKSWQICSALGPTFEKLVSAKSMNDCYMRLLGVTELPEDRFPQMDAVDGNPVALTWMDTVTMVLAELIFERMYTIKNGRANAPYRNDAYLKLKASHPYLGTMLDTVVVGQRMGQIYADKQFAAVFGDKLEKHLAAAIAKSNDPEMIEKYLAGDKLAAGVLVASKLRAAPALGAAVAAVEAMLSKATSG